MNRRYMFTLIIMLLYCFMWYSLKPDEVQYDLTALVAPSLKDCNIDKSQSNDVFEQDIEYEKIVQARMRALQIAKVNGLDLKKEKPHSFWDFYPACPNFCPFKVSRVGRHGDGGKWLCNLERLKMKSNCIVYSFGVSNDSSFEDELVKNTDCIVYAYDPTVKQIGYPVDPSNPKIKFQPIGIGGKDQNISSVLGMQLNYPLKTLKTLMRENGHEWIDVLKIDVEGYEYESLSRVLGDFQQVLPFDQLLIEVHLSWISSEEVYSLVIPWWDALERMGLRPYFTEDGSPTRREYSFINIRNNIDPNNFRK
ncbi:unnamed protein product [Orchesella dallaii]|uniref:Methyltransferase domain-containing protein n=1 Tax=Orchesella dallaii TaxID=48710 RepID=A0ABP1QE49_9HEXA